MSSDGLFVEKQLSYSRASSNPTCDQKAWCEYAVFLTCHVGQHYFPVQSLKFFSGIQFSSSVMAAFVSIIFILLYNYGCRTY